jgi:hypothetical protein
MYFPLYRLPKEDTAQFHSWPPKVSDQEAFDRMGENAAIITPGARVVRRTVIITPGAPIRCRVRGLP